MAKIKGKRKIKTKNRNDLHCQFSALEESFR